MTRLTLFFLAIISLSASGQDSTNSINLADKLKRNQDSIEYIKESVEFIKQVKGLELLNSTFILNDKPFTFEYFDCLKELLVDTLTYTREELTFIEQRKNASISYWPKELLPKTKFISSNTVDSIFKGRSKGWTYFYKKIGHAFNNFSVPIFLRNDSYCLFYSDNRCGGLCGTGKLTLFKWEDNKWKEVKSYCDWIS